MAAHRSAPSTVVAAALVAVALGALGCNAGDHRLRLGQEGTQPPTKAKLWTLWDIQSALIEGRKVAPSPSFPAGFEPQMFLEASPGGEQQLRVIPAFSEGDAAAYVSGEVWVNFDEVYAQPWYVQLTAWNEMSPGATRLRDGTTIAPPIWDVSPNSLFYSPLWLYIYVVVPPGTTIDTYRSSEQLFNDGLEMHVSGGWTFSARPDEVVGEAMPAMGSERAGLTHPILGTPIGNLRMGTTSWADGKPYAYFDQGSNNFRFDSRLVVEEVPQFVLAKRGPSGAPEAIGAPNVMGVGPLFSHRPADAPNGRPRFGAYSRLYFALVGAGARAFDPEEYPIAAQALAEKAAADKTVNPKAYIGRVANNAVTTPTPPAPPGGCFNSPMFPAGCQWLDSQRQIEDTLGEVNIRRTEISMSSALVFYAGKGIGR